MIIINLMGGLGNQMFQYAAAKQLSIIHNTPLKIDASNFRKLTSNKEHNFQLNQFCISARQARALCNAFDNSAAEKTGGRDLLYHVAFIMILIYASS